MKCTYCGSNNVVLNSDTPIMLNIKCLSCELSFTVSKMAVGKKHDLFFYLDLLRDKIRENEYLVVEARGDLIPKMLIIVCNVVDKDGLVEIESVDVLCRKDAKNKEVATERVLLKRKTLPYL